jgi:probable HAF family extracellular repeat protein
VKRLSFFFLLCLAGFASSQQYHLSDLGAVGIGNNSTAMGINNSGQVVGQSDTPYSLIPAVWTNGFASSLGTLLPGAAFPTAWAINDSGQIVGTEIDGSSGYSWVFSGGKLNDISYALQQFPFGYAINNAGDVAGNARIPGVTLTAFWFAPGTNGYSNGVGTLLGLLGGTFSYAYGLNNSGIAVGCAQTDTMAVHAARFVPGGGPYDLGTLGGTSACAQAVNDSGTIVGYSNPFGDGAEHAFSYTNGVWTDLGTLGGTNSYAQAINASGVIVGYSDLSGTTSPFVMPLLSKDSNSLGQEEGHAFVYSNGKMQDLNSVVDSSGSGYQITSANGINDQGQIVARALHYGDTRAVLLTPTGGQPTFDKDLLTNFYPYVSKDGSVIAGVINYGDSNQEAAEVTATGLHVLPCTGIYPYVAGISDDGKTIVGFKQLTDGTTVGTSWVNGIEVPIPAPPKQGTYFRAACISGDGTKIGVSGDLGFNIYDRASGTYTNEYFYSASAYVLPPQFANYDGSAFIGLESINNGYGLYKWTAAGGFQALGPALTVPPGYYINIEPACASEDLSVVYGYMYAADYATGQGTGYYSFIWRPTTGYVLLPQDYGISDCSSDGSIAACSEGIWTAATGLLSPDSFYNLLSLSPPELTGNQTITGLSISGDAHKLFETIYDYSLGNIGGYETALPPYTSWDLANNFSYTSNPAGPFTYGQILSGSFLPLSTVVYNGVDQIWLSPESPNKQGGMISLHLIPLTYNGINPGSVDLDSDFGTPVARFTAPYTGNFNFNVQLGGSTATSQEGGSGNANAVNAQLLVNGVPQQGTFAGNIMSWQLLGLHLNKGDTVDALVPQGSGTGGNTNTVFSVGSFAGGEPVLSNSFYSTSYMTNLTSSAPGVLANATNAQGGVSLLQGPTNSSSFTLNADGSFSYTPTTGFAGRDAFVYTVPGAPQGATATITVASHLSNISPSSIAAGSSDLQVKVNGNGFYTGAYLDFNGALIPTTVTSPTQLTATIPASLLAGGVTANVSIYDIWGDFSNTIHAYVTNPTPALNTLSPNTIYPGSPDFVLTVNGSGFVPGSTVKFQGKGVTTSFVSSTQLTAQIPASAVAIGKTVDVLVTNPVPGGGNSASLPFTVANPLPTLSSVSPTSVTIGTGSLLLQVNGIGFVPNTAVKWGGKGVTTTYVSPTEVTAMVPTSMFALVKTVAVTAVNPTPGGGASNAVNVQVVKG